MALLLPGRMRCRSQPADHHPRQNDSDPLATILWKEFPQLTQWNRRPYRRVRRSFPLHHRRSIDYRQESYGRGGAVIRRSMRHILVLLTHVADTTAPASITRRPRL